jgi:bacteriocin-like protein
VCELTNDELDAVSGGALGFIEPRFPRDAGGGGDAGPAINAWNTLLHQYGAA